MFECVGRICFHLIDIINGKKGIEQYTCVHGTQPPNNDNTRTWTCWMVTFDGKWRVRAHGFNIIRWIAGIQHQKARSRIIIIICFIIRYKYVCMYFFQIYLSVNKGCFKKKISFFQIIANDQWFHFQNVRIATESLARVFLSCIIFSGSHTAGCLSELLDGSRFSSMLVSGRWFKVSHESW